MTDFIHVYHTWDQDPKTKEFHPTHVNWIHRSKRGEVYYHRQCTKEEYDSRGTDTDWPMSLKPKRICPIKWPLNPEYEDYPKAPPSVNTDDPDVFLKVPSWSYYDGDNDPKLTFIGQQIKGELNNARLLKSHPHQNIAEFLGIKTGINDEGKEDIRGLYFRRYKCTLHDRIQDTTLPILDIERVNKEVLSAIKHIHKLGRVHGDIKPDNIMLDENDKSYVIDFDSMSCQGSSSSDAGKGGTEPWYNPPKPEDVSQYLQDDLALLRVMKWMQKTTRKMEKKLGIPETEAMNTSQNGNEKRKREEETEESDDDDDEDIIDVVEVPNGIKKALELVVRKPQPKKRKVEENENDDEEDPIDVVEGPNEGKKALGLVVKEPQPKKQKVMEEFDAEELARRKLQHERSIAAKKLIERAIRKRDLQDQREEREERKQRERMKARLARV